MLKIWVSLKWKVAKSWWSDDDEQKWSLEVRRRLMWEETVMWFAGVIEVDHCRMFAELCSFFPSFSHLLLHLLSPRPFLFIPLPPPSFLLCLFVSLIESKKLKLGRQHSGMECEPNVSLLHSKNKMLICTDSELFTLICFLVICHFTWRWSLMCQTQVLLPAFYLSYNYPPSLFPLTERQKLAQM